MQWLQAKLTSCNAEEPKGAVGVDFVSQSDQVEAGGKNVKTSQNEELYPELDRNAWVEHRVELLREGSQFCSHDRVY